MILARPTWLVRQRGGARARVPTPCHLQPHKRKALITDHNSEDEKMKPGHKSLQHRMNFPIPASTRPLLCCCLCQRLWPRCRGQEGTGEALRVHTPATTLTQRHLEAQRKTVLMPGLCVPLPSASLPILCCSVARKSVKATLCDVVSLASATHVLTHARTQRANEMLERDLARARAIRTSALAAATPG